MRGPWGTAEGPSWCRRAGGDSEGLRASGETALRGATAPPGAEPRLVLVPAVLWGSSRGWAGPGLPAAGLSWLCGPRPKGRDPTGKHC